MAPDLQQIGRQRAGQGGGRQLVVFGVLGADTAGVSVAGHWDRPPQGCAPTPAPCGLCPDASARWPADSPPVRLPGVPAIVAPQRPPCPPEAVSKPAMGPTTCTVS